MKLSVLAALALVIGLGNATHAGCVDAPCIPDERPTSAPQATDATLALRIENALKDLEIANARAFKADKERMNAICAMTNCATPESTTKRPFDR
jgi:hypothetical protein